MSLVREAGSKAVAHFTTPYRGTWRAVSAHQLTLDAVYDSMNVFIRQGKLRSRPGLSLLNSTAFNSPVLGGGMAVTPTDKVLVAITKDRCYELPSAATQWTQTSTGVYAADNNASIDITFTQVGTNIIGVVASANQLVKQWNIGVGISPIVAAQPSTQTIPTAISVCTTGRRIIALIAPHTVAWTSVLSFNDWPALATVNISSTNDSGVCVVSLSNLAFVLYKERSIYLARAQAGSDASAFNFAEPISVEGPAGVHAVVNIHGAHMYMTKNGRIGSFDGTRYPQWIADGLWLFLQGDIDPVYANKIFGVYDYRLHTAIFYYPKIGDSGQLKGMVVINMPLEGGGILEGRPLDQAAIYLGILPASFLGVSSRPCSYGYEMRFNNTIDRNVLFTADNLNSTILNELAQDDSGSPFTSSFQTGLATLPDMVHHQLNVESWLERADGYGSVTISAVTSDTLESTNGSVDTSNPQIIDLNINPVREYIGFNIPTRFFGLQYSWDSTSTVQYAGATAYGRAVA